MRVLLLLAILTTGAAVVAPSPAASGTSAPATCAGRTVTIDLNKPGHPGPRRPRADIILGTPHDDRIETGGGDDVICGGRGADILRPGAGDDLAIAGDGDDYLYAEGDDEEVLRGGDGADFIFATGSGSDRIVGGSGSDTVTSGADADVIRAGDGHDIVYPGGAADGSRDLTYLGPGADVIDATESDELIDGGPGADKVWYLRIRSDSHIGVTIDFALSGPQDAGASGMDELVAIEQLSGSRHDDAIFGDDARNILGGYRGDDVIDGRGGADRCYGGAGTDAFAACETVRNP